VTGDAAPEVNPRGASLESYRINLTARVWPFLVTATVFISLGALGVCMAFVTHGPLQPYANEITIVGGAFMLAGLLLTLLVVKPVLAHDEYLVAFEGGLLWKLEAAERFVVWDDIATVRWDAEREGKGAVVITLNEGEPVVVVRTFGRGSGQEIATQIDTLRRKAIFWRRS
jgi:hypothetical protein